MTRSTTRYMRREGLVHEEGQRLVEGQGLVEGQRVVHVELASSCLLVCVKTTRMQNFINLDVVLMWHAS